LCDSEIGKVVNIQWARRCLGWRRWQSCPTFDVAARLGFYHPGHWKEGTNTQSDG
jgi:hypothetical protein